MKCCSKSINLTKQYEDKDAIHLIGINYPKEQLLDMILSVIKPVVEYALGMHVGFLLGWLIGFCIGHCYVEHFQPVYIEDFSQLSWWNTAPNLFARYGALMGLLIGIIAIGKINNKLLSRQVISLIDNKTMNLSEIALVLDKNAAQIKQILNKMAKKGRISRQQIST